MNFATKKVTIKQLFITTFTVMSVLFYAACDDGIKPPTPVPPESHLNIEPFNGSYEVDINTNMRIKGEYLDDQDFPIRGVRVNFSVNPSDNGAITPFGTTEPDSSNGFIQEIIYSAERYGEVVIRGWINRTDGAISDEDSMKILVRPPVNQ